MDDAYLGGARAGGKRGRGAPGKTHLRGGGLHQPRGPRRCKVKAGPESTGFRKPPGTRRIAVAKRWLVPGSEPSLHRRPALVCNACSRRRPGRKPSWRDSRTGIRAARPPFKWVNTTLGQHRCGPPCHRSSYRKLVAFDRWPSRRTWPASPGDTTVALPGQHHGPALRSQRRRNPTDPILGVHSAPMTFMDKQDLL